MTDIKPEVWLYPPTRGKVYITEGTTEADIEQEIIAKNGHRSEWVRRVTVEGWKAVYDGLYKNYRQLKADHEAEVTELRNKLEDVVNELDLSAFAIEKHGPLGTAPAELVRLVLMQKDQAIRKLRAGLTSIIPEEASDE